MTLVKWNPTRELLNIEKEFNRLFNSFGRRFGTEKELDSELENAVWMPLADIAEDNNNYSIHIDLPGINKEDVKISFANGELSISGERKQEKESKNSKYHRIERSYGKYFRSFRLPENIEEDKIKADFKDGALMISIPKSEKARPKEIQINVN